MEYIYTAMLIHKAGKKVDENNVKKVLESAGVTPDDTRVRALVAALDGVNIDEAIQKAAVVQVAATAPSHEEKKEEKKADKKEEKKDEEDAAAGLGALFG